MATLALRGAATERAHDRLRAALELLDPDGTAALRDVLAAPFVRGGKDVEETLAAHAEALAVVAECLAGRLTPASSKTRVRRGGEDDPPAKECVA